MRATALPGRSAVTAGRAGALLRNLVVGLTAFFTMSIMLSLLIFVGEAVRDAFDPRKTFR